ncbi:hypothetical protein KM043_011811 [Ampulex compressa]|nr:hypothetical protein KM043_011811 [Ampulex compressa]
MQAAAGGVKYGPSSVPIMKPCLPWRDYAKFVHQAWLNLVREGVKETDHFREKRGRAYAIQDGATRSVYRSHKYSRALRLRHKGRALRGHEERNEREDSFVLKRF